jgi:hypothetical protein
MKVWVVIEEFPDDAGLELTVHGSEEKARAKVQGILDFHADEGRALVQWEGKLIWSHTNEYYVEIQEQEVQ